MSANFNVFPAKLFFQQQKLRVYFSIKINLLLLRAKVDKKT